MIGAVSSGVLAQQSSRSQIINENASDMRERQIRSKNVVIHGVVSQDDAEKDKSAIKELLHELHIDGVEVVKVHRMQPRSISSSEDENEQVRKEKKCMFQVVLGDADQQKAVLAAARRHTFDGRHRGAFLHMDRTRAEQEQFRLLDEQRRKRNDELKELNLLDKYRYVLRTDRVRCIDMVKSSAQQRSWYVSGGEIGRAVKEAKSNKSNGDDAQQQKDRATCQ
jgi:hypothetical protein